MLLVMMGTDAHIFSLLNREITVVIIYKKRKGKREERNRTRRCKKMDKKTKVLISYNQKGGVAKTTTCVNLAQILGDIYHKKVLLIDSDPQNSLSFLANVDISQSGALASETGIPDLGYLEGMFQWYGDVCDADDLRRTIITPKYVKRVRVPGTIEWTNEECDFAFDLLPGYDSDLSLVEMLFVAPTDEPWILAPDNRKYARYMMKMIVDRIKEYYDYDYIIIDCPPSLGIISINALVAGDYLFIPTTPDMLSTVGINVIIRNLNDLKLYVPDFNILGILFGSYAGTKADDELIRDVEEYGREQNINVFRTRIPRINAMRNISSEEGIAVLNSNKAFRNYRASIISLAEEILAQTEGKMPEKEDER